MSIAIPQRPLRATCLLLSLAVLAACSSKKELAAAPPPPEVEVVEVHVPDLDGRGSYRFEMSDGDRRLTADEFDAWMKANGIRISTGKEKVGKR